jgi:hypothetical protein
MHNAQLIGAAQFAAQRPSELANELNGMLVEAALRQQ